MMIGDHQQDADEERPGEVVERLLDEGGGTEERRVDLDVGQSGLHLLEACSTPRVTSIVLAPRYFCTTSIKP